MQRKIVIVLFIFCFLRLKGISEAYGDNNDTGLNSELDYNLDFPQTVEKLGLICVEHDVITEDNYILQLFNLPGNKSRPVFLLSGNLGSADDYIARGDTSLPAVLQRAGYDVWVGNWRGCRYGRRHVTLDPDKQQQFWDFSYHEYAVYDVPAMLDYVLNATGAKRVACIAWSLGTTAFYVLGTERPEYTDKVAVVIALAPFAYSYHSTTFEAVAPLYPFLEGVFELFNVQEIIGYNSTLTTVFRYVCCSKDLGFEVCMRYLIYQTSGTDERNLEPSFTPMMFGRFPSSSSRKTLRHLAQGLIGHKFAYYDYGPTQNLQKYGSVVAPEYPLHKNNMTFIMVSGMNDLVSTMGDVEMVKAKLPNVAEHIVLEAPDFNHFDFVYGKNSHKDLYHKYILGLLKKYLS